MGNDYCTLLIGFTTETYTEAIVAGKAKGSVSSTSGYDSSDTYPSSLMNCLI